jgi:hypothetical protein
VLVNHRADLFSLGVVLWNALTGKTLYRREDKLVEVFARNVPRPSTVGLCPPAIFDSIVLKALERDPARRFDSAEDMVHALRDVALQASCLGAPMEVAAWVSRLFGDEIAARREVRTLTSAIAVPAVSVSSSMAAPVSATRPRVASVKPRRHLGIVAGLAGVVVISVLGWQWAARGDTTLPASAAPPAPRGLAVSVLEVRSIPAVTTPPPPPAVTKPAIVEPPQPPPAVTVRSAPTPPPVRRTTPARPALTRPKPAVATPSSPPKPADATHTDPPATKPASPAKPADTPPLESNPYVYK